MTLMLTNHTHNTSIDSGTAAFLLNTSLVTSSHDIFRIPWAFFLGNLLF